MPYAKDILTNAEQAVNKKVYLSEIAKGTAFGGAAGALIGLTYAHFRDKNIYIHAIAGMLIGGIISRLFIIK
jgi:hypothetical protein